MDEYLSVVQKWVQQAHVREYFDGLSFAMWINSSISAILFTRENHSDRVGLQGDFHLAEIHNLAALIMCIPRDFLYMWVEVEEWWRMSLVGVKSMGYVVTWEVMS